MNDADFAEMARKLIDGWAEYGDEGGREYWPNEDNLAAALKAAYEAGREDNASVLSGKALRLRQLHEERRVAAERLASAGRLEQAMALMMPRPIFDAYGNEVGESEPLLDLTEEEFLALISVDPKR